MPSPRVWQSECLARRDEVQGLGRSSGGSRRFGRRPSPRNVRLPAAAVQLRRGGSRVRACERHISSSRWRPLTGPETGPDLVVSELAIKVERVADFSRAHDLGLEIVGYPMGPFRVGRVPGEPTVLAAVERRGYLGFEPFPGELGAKAG